mgnify:CR=1 FL=1|jgi:hypothetical protein
MGDPAPTPGGDRLVTNGAGERDAGWCWYWKVPLEETEEAELSGPDMLSIWLADDETRWASLRASGRGWSEALESGGVVAQQARAGRWPCVPWWHFSEQTKAAHALFTTTLGVQGGRRVRRKRRLGVNLTQLIQCQRRY